MSLGEPASVPDPIAVAPRHFVPDTPWGPVSGVAMTVAIGLFALALCVVAVLALAAPLLGELANDTAAALQRPEMMWVLLVGGVAMQAASTAATWFAAGLRGGRPVGVLALRPSLAGSAKTVLLVLGFVVFGVAAGGLVDLVFPHDPYEDVRAIAQMINSDAWWLAFILIVIGAPVSEELLFRGFLLSALAKSRLLGFIGAVVLSSALWAVVHGYSPQGLTVVFLLGLALGYILWQTGSTWVTMLCHALYNGVSFAIVKLYFSTPVPG